jgi:hypothetical protein
MSIATANSPRAFLVGSTSVSGPSGGGGADSVLSADFVAKVEAEQLASKNAQQSNLEKWIFE